MKKNIILILLTLSLSTALIKAQNEDIELTKMVFSPDPDYVDIDGRVELNPVFVTNKDTVRIKPELIESWLLDGKPDPEHIIINGSSYYYSPKGKMPANNPVTISAVLTNGKGETKFTVITRINVTENESHFTLSKLNGSTSYYKIESKSFVSGGINAGNTMGFFSKGQNQTACALNDLNTNIGVSISFSGCSTGSFPFSKTNAVGISMGSGSCGSFDAQGEPTSGTIDIIKYDNPDGKIKVNINGIVTDGNNNQYILNGTFIVTRSSDVN